MPLTAPAAQTETQKFVARLRQSLADGSFVKLGLGRPHGSDPTLLKLLARRVVIKGQPQLSLVWRHRTKDITKNLPTEAAVHLVDSLLGDAAEAGFHHAHLQTTGHDIQLARGRKGQWGLRIGRLAAAAPPATAAASAASAATTSAAAADDASAADPPEADADGRYLGHDRARRHPLALTLPFLAELGITDAQQRLVPSMARKWRQINKFVEVLGHAIAQSPLAQRDPAQPVRVLDFGAGKGYLTFAVHEHLRASGRLPDVTGVELRGELATLCNQAVARLGLQGLRFDAGDVRSHPAGATDIMIALHACDTATDVAMHRGVTLHRKSMGYSL